MNQKKVIIGALVVVFIGIGIWVFSGIGKKLFVNPKGVVNKESLSSNQPAGAKNSESENSANNMSATLLAESGINKKIMNATMKTSLGEIKLELSGDKTPITVTNFVKLAESGFYNGVKFHRVIKGFMIQGGDPLTKDDSLKARWGSGGPGYQFNDEPFSGDYSRGTLAMANSGPNTNGSQFFVTVAKTPWLDGHHTIFGQVIKGQDIVDKIVNVPSNSDRPIEPVSIESITITNKKP